MFVTSTLWGHFPFSLATSTFLVAIDYVLKWVEAVPTRTNDNKIIVKFLKENIPLRCPPCDNQ